MIKKISSIDDCHDLDGYDYIVIDICPNIEDIINELKDCDLDIIINVDISKDNYEVLSKLVKYNMYINVNYNTSCCDNSLDMIDTCTLKQFLNMDLILNRYVDNINSKNYSNLEKCVYAYDIAKLNRYKS